MLNSEERLLRAARQTLAHSVGTETKREYKLRKKNERKQNWNDKSLHGQFIRQTEEDGGKKRSQWLSGTGNKKETESLIMAALVIPGYF